MTESGNRRDLLNVLSGYFSRSWAVIGNFIFVPIYILMYGEDGYGVIVIGASITLIVALLDAGLTPVVTKYVAAGVSCGRVQELFQSSYRLILKVAVISVILCLALNFITSSKVFNISTALQMLILISAFLHLLTSIYRGLYIGNEDHFWYNSTSTVYAVSRSGAPVLLAFIDSSLEMYFVSQSIVSACYSALLYRDSHQRYFSLQQKNKLDDISPINAAFVRTMLYITILSTFINQFDRIFVAYFYELELVGRYVNTLMLAQAGSLLLLPILAVVYPKMIRLTAENGYWGLGLSGYAYVVLIINSIYTMVAFVYLPLIYELWTGVVFDERLLIPYNILVISNFLNGLQLLPYHFMLARGKVYGFFIILFIGATSLPLALYFIGRSGQFELWPIPVLTLNILITIFLFMHLYSANRLFFFKYLYCSLAASGIPAATWIFKNV